MEYLIKVILLVISTSFTIGTLYYCYRVLRVVRQNKLWILFSMIPLVILARRIITFTNELPNDMTPIIALNTVILPLLVSAMLFAFVWKFAKTFEHEFMSKSQKG